MVQQIYTQAYLTDYGKGVYKSIMVITDIITYQYIIKFEHVSVSL